MLSASVPTPAAAAPTSGRISRREIPEWSGSYPVGGRLILSPPGEPQTAYAHVMPGGLYAGNQFAIYGSTWTADSDHVSPLPGNTLRVQLPGPDNTLQRVKLVVSSLPT